MQQNSNVYLKVDLTLAREIGVGEAFLFAFILFVAQKRPKDTHGFFTIESKYICHSLNWPRNTLMRRRDKLVECGLIEFRQGSNQNTKSYYKIANKHHR